MHVVRVNRFSSVFLVQENILSQFTASMLYFIGIWKEEHDEWEDALVDWIDRWMPSKDGWIGERLADGYGE